MPSKFERHALIPGWQQARLENACIVIMGAGALGSEAARLLAMTGVGKIILCDPDRVELSNLSRTPLYTESDIGSFKVEAARDALRLLAPSMEVDARSLPMVNGVGLAELRDASLVLGCLDSRAARVQLAGRCGLVRAPSIDGGTDPWGGEVRSFLDPDGPCYACALTPGERAVTDVPWSCLDVVSQSPEGAAAPSSALVASWMSMYAVRHLMGLSVPKGAVSINAAQGNSRVTSLLRDSECPLHHPLADSTKSSLGHRDVVRDLLDELGAEAFPLLWDPARSCGRCEACGHEAGFLAPLSEIACPQCGAKLICRTTLELSSVPRELKLASIGIAPREILAVRTARGMSFHELNS